MLLSGKVFIRWVGAAGGCLRILRVFGEHVNCSSWRVQSRSKFLCGFMWARVCVRHVCSPSPVTCNIGDRPGYVVHPDHSL